jgi:hypothetical protein
MVFLLACQASTSPLACNGFIELCGRPFNEVALPSTHNSMSSAEGGFVPPNQNTGIKWLSTPISSPANAEEANSLEILGTRAAQCQQETGHIPNLVAVDFYEIGALFEVVEQLNSVEAAP